MIIKTTAGHYHAICVTGVRTDKLHGEGTLYFLELLLFGFASVRYIVCLCVSEVCLLFTCWGVGQWVLSGWAEIRRRGCGLSCGAVGVGSGSNASRTARWRAAPGDLRTESPVQGRATEAQVLCYK